jgi:hypothetical protein
LVKVPNDVWSGCSAGLDNELQETKASSDLVSVLDSRSLIPVREARDENEVKLGFCKRLDQLTAVLPHCLQNLILLVHRKNELGLGGETQSPSEFTSRDERGCCADSIYRNSKCGPVGALKSGAGLHAGNVGRNGW